MLRPIGTQYTERWATYTNEHDGSIDSPSRKCDEQEHCRVLEVIGHENGKEICRILEEY